MRVLPKPLLRSRPDYRGTDCLKQEADPGKFGDHRGGEAISWVCTTHLAGDIEPGGKARTAESRAEVVRPPDSRTGTGTSIAANGG